MPSDGPQSTSIAVEREGLDEGSPWWAEHRSRYRFAQPFTTGRRVLDIACGSGLGLDLVTADAAFVLGIDISEEGLRTARSVHAERFSACRADGTRIPLASGSIDLVLSFETVEHIEKDRAFIAELRRVVHDDGLLILSTPNALYTKPVAGVPSNPFHVREYEPADLKTLLSEFFDDVQLLAHRVDPSYGPCPYWDVSSSENRGQLLRSLIWKILARASSRTREWTHRALFGVPFYPGQEDFVFVADQIEQGHVLLAVCRP